MELFVNRGGGAVLVQGDDQGHVRSDALGATFATAPGPRLLVSWEGGTAEM